MREILSNKWVSRFTYHQVRETIINLSFINPKKNSEINDLVRCLRLEMFLKGDLISKEMEKDNKFYFISQGEVEKFSMTEDIAYYDFRKVQEYMNKQHEVIDKVEEVCTNEIMFQRLNSEAKTPEHDSSDLTSKNLLDSQFGSKARRGEKEESPHLSCVQNSLLDITEM